MRLARRGGDLLDTLVMSLEQVTGLRCVRCGTIYSRGTEGTCASCGLDGILDVVYDDALVRKTLTRAALAERTRTQWRYRELLPIGDGPLPSLAVGMTPLYQAPRLAASLGLARAFVKDDGRNPTGSFKDRASAIGVVKAREANARVIACASTGNAASSLSGFAAAIDMPAVIFVPKRAPEAKVAQLLIFGATVLRVNGTYDEAWQLCQDACARHGWYNRNCAVNPYLVEGKKTVGLELAEELGDRMPEWVVLSVGDGCTIAGAWKGLCEGHRLGWIPRLPKLLGVQASGARAMVDLMTMKGEPDSLGTGEAVTIADSIAVGQPRNWRKAIRAVRASGGAMIAVEDSEILAAMRSTARLSGVFAEPAAAAATAGLARAVVDGLVARHEGAVVVVTGNGLKDVRSALTAVGQGVQADPSVVVRLYDIEATAGAVDDAVERAGVTA